MVKMKSLHQSNNIAVRLNLNLGFTIVLFLCDEMYIHKTRMTERA